MYGKLKFESGVHRVQVSFLEWLESFMEASRLKTISLWQRVPVTEKSGRIHTSAVSVAVLPQADQVHFLLSAKWKSIFSP